MESKTKEWINVCNPATNEVRVDFSKDAYTNLKVPCSNINKYTKVITRVPKSTLDEMESAVSAAKAAYQTWSKTSVLSRQQVMLRYQHIIRNNMV